MPCVTFWIFFLPHCLFPKLPNFLIWLQGYSWEITTVEGGYGLDELLSSRKSVLNGMDFVPCIRCYFYWAFSLLERWIAEREGVDFLMVSSTLTDIVLAMNSVVERSWYFLISTRPKKYSTQTFRVLWNFDSLYVTGILVHACLFYFWGLFTPYLLVLQVRWTNISFSNLIVVS